ncbi:MAG: histidine phosphatase family protein [Deltaproteobacteria bacterium]|jgi:broad specificity phosphatase PhoE|nr:histidine phosphatase family protein [Deltaproteobacteria bacterium]MBW2535415.1 histidine phosphatase family protein [Deltaproteobacteria bacterium]
MRKLYLLRHAETTANADGTLQGRLDYPLTERGRAQAEALAQPLASLGCELVLRSPAERVLRTIEPALEVGLAAPEVVDELHEIDLGDAAGLSFGEFLERFGPTIDEESYARGEYRFPGGESRRDLYQRAAQAWRFIERRDADTVLLASHGGLLSQLLAVVLDLPNDGRVRFRLDNAALTTLVWFRGQPFLSRFNEREHLTASLRSPVFAPRIFEGASPAAK